LKEARPDLAKEVGDTISVTAALRLGGYDDAEAMNANLEATLNKNQRQLQEQRERSAAGQNRKK
jgi:hypothetical protein